MFEKALKGGKLYWSWIAFLCLLILIGLASYSVQWQKGLTITGMGKEVSWGLYIANFTFLVGVAASAVVVALPTYIYNQHKFEKMTTLGEFLAVAAVTMCILFILVDLGKPMRALHVLLYPSPNSVMFFDFIVLSGYALWNIIIAWYILSSRITGTDISWYVKLIIYIAIPWAISIHTVTAYIYSGLVARGMWMTALLAPRFLASAFAAGPSMLIIAAIVARKYANFDVGKDVIRIVAQMVTFAMIVNMFFLGCELFVVFYSQHPEHMAHWTYLLFGMDGYGKLVPWIWASIGLGIFAVLMLIHPTTRKNDQ
ncbi:menaquinol oxidoreductase, partial [Archaeoglobales archaeon]